MNALEIKDYNDVYVAIRPISAQWKDLGTRLGIQKPTLDIIEANHRGNVVECMAETIDSWLRRDVCDGAAIPTWRNLCIALSPIDRALAEMISVEHGCNYISPTVSEVTSQNNKPPAFLPQSCGCGHCTVRGWMSGRVCQNMYVDKRPMLLVVNPEHPVASDFTVFGNSYDRQARLCSETSQIVKHFASVSLDTWRCLRKIIREDKYPVADIALELGVLFKNPLPTMSSLQELQSYIHSLRVSWFNFAPLYFLAEQFLSNNQELMASWNSYRASLKEYCSGRNLKNFVNVFFKVEDQNVFLLEVDECYYNFTLFDIRSLRRSLCSALGVSSVCLHLVTVRGGSVIIYFYYCYSNYMVVFNSLTREQLRMISEIKAYKIMSLVDLHNQFRYENIQRYSNDEASFLSRTKLFAKGQSNSCEDLRRGSDELSAELEKMKNTVKMLKKQSVMKDIELSRQQNETSETKRELFFLKKQLAAKEREIFQIQRNKDRELTKKDVEIGRIRKKSRDELSIAQRKQEELSRIQHQLLTAMERKQEAFQLWKKLPFAKKDDEKTMITRLAVIKELSGRPIRTIDLEFGHYHIALCDNGDILATEWNIHSITILNKEGDKVKSLGMKGTEKGQLNFPTGVALSTDGHVLVTDRHRLQKLTFDGICVASIGGSESGSGQLQFNYPYGIAVHSETGQIFVADKGNNRVQVFNASLSSSHVINSANGKQFKWPYDVALDNEGHLYIAEYDNHCITKVTVTGQYIACFGDGYGSAPGQLDCPNSVIINRSHNLVYVSEYSNNRISVFNTHGRFLHCFDRQGEFIKPWGVALDKLGNLYVSDYVNNRIVVY